MSDYAVVRAVKDVCATRLPSVLVELILEFANWNNVEWKRICLYNLRNRAWLSKVAMLRNITRVQIIQQMPTYIMIGYCPSKEQLRNSGAPIIRVWARYLNHGILKK